MLNPSLLAAATKLMKGKLGGQAMRKVAISNALSVRTLQQRVEADGEQVAVPGECDIGLKVSLDWSVHREFAVLRISGETQKQKGQVKGP